MHDSGASRREVANAYLELEHRHCERSEAIHSFFMWLYGLLRFARNDGSTIGSLKIEAGLCTDMMISQRSKITPSYPVMTAPRCRSCRPLGFVGILPANPDAFERRKSDMGRGRTP